MDSTINPMEKISSQRIRAYVIKEELSIAFFQTAIHVNCYDSNNGSDSVVTVIYHTPLESRIARNVLESIVKEKGDEFRGILVDVLAEDNPKVEKYKSGDF